MLSRCRNIFVALLQDLLVRTRVLRRSEEDVSVDGWELHAMRLKPGLDLCARTLAESVRVLVDVSDSVQDAFVFAGYDLNFMFMPGFQSLWDRSPNGDQCTDVLISSVHARQWLGCMGSSGLLA